MVNQEKDFDLLCSLLRCDWLTAVYSNFSEFKFDFFNFFPVIKASLTTDATVNC